LTSAHRHRLPVIIVSLLLLCGADGFTQTKDPVDYVDPNIGGIGHLLSATSPAVHLPYAMISIAPQTTPGIRDRYLADKIYGFPAGAATFMATVGSLETDPSKQASPFDHDLETTTPYYYAASLMKYNVEAEYTVSERAVYYRFTFPANAEAHLMWNASSGGEIKVVGPAALAGSPGSKGERTYFYAEISKPFASSSVYSSEPIGVDGRPANFSVQGLALNFRVPNQETISLRIGISHISTEVAKENLRREIPTWDFERTKMNARTIWNSALGSILVKGGTKDERTIFYTALYRSMGRMVDITENDQYYSGYDHQIHSADGRPFYVDDGVWDTYRSLHPLQLILDPKRQEDMIQSYVRMYEQSGWLPSFPQLSGDGTAMIGYHAAALIADTYLKGYRNFNVEKAYEGLRARAMEGTLLPWRSGPLTAYDRVYQEKGFFPALAKGEAETIPEVNPREKRQAVAVTLETSYDDWCLAQLAKVLKKDADYSYFMKRAGNYRNVFDERIGFMAPKSADGNWVEDFDPKMGGGWGGREYFAEMNSWTYTFQVQHAIPGLITIMGGRDKFLQKLDSLFVEQYDGPKYKYLAQWDNATGLIGQYAQGDEPSFHIPYLYNYAGQPWKTQQMVREIMKIWYNAGPLGICGDDDGGAMSSWYVLSAMGFYPVTPGRPLYNIGSPIFEETRIALKNGKVFTIIARDVSAKNKYIQSAELNGKPWNKPWFDHAAIVDGSTLVLQMGPRPNLAWGSAADDAPPSM
jgi:predicted alpha-1,2-mannosidase